ncbi:MAG: hypothetical protein FVQ85_21375 [Planctomycetes bacterium]|nr:hypothetical protein [Planctomycetota bacterium]
MGVERNPFEIIRTEDFNSNYKIIAEYFSDPKASYYSSLKRRGNTILVGTRGSGKTMLLKSLYLPVHAEIMKKEGKDPLVDPIKFVGILINCERYEFKIFRENVFDYHKQSHDEVKISQFWKQCFGYYFSLLIIEEMLNTIITHGPCVGLNFSQSLYGQLAQKIIHTCQLQSDTDSSSIDFKLLASMLKEKRKKFSRLMNDSILDIDYSIIKNKFNLSAVIEVGEILQKIPRFSNARFYLLLDDFFHPNLADEQQEILLELIRVRNEPLAFKIATLPGGMVFTDDSGFELTGRADEFTIESMEFPKLTKGSSYYSLVKQIVNNRLEQYGLTHKDLFEESEDNTRDFLAKLRGEVRRGHTKCEYAGFNTLVHLSSGVIRTFLLLGQKIIDKHLNQESSPKLSKFVLPVPVDVQTEIVNNESSEYLDAIESYKNGALILKLVHYLGKEARDKLLSNETANEHIQFQIKNYPNLEESAKEILTRAVTKNVFHAYQLSHRTNRRGYVSIKSLVLNRLFTPALRIPYRDRWRIDVDVDTINEILQSTKPINISNNRPVKQYTLNSAYCPVISGECDKIDSSITVNNGCFYASPIQTNWTAIAKDFFNKQFKKFEFAPEYPPKGLLTCKICEMIHRNYFGIYEITDLNENVIFELALALARKKHAFAIVNTEAYKYKQIKALLGIEYIPYQVVEDEIKEVCKEKIKPEIRKDEPWNAKEINRLQSKTLQENVLLAMPQTTRYYTKTLTKKVKSTLEDKFKYKVIPSNDYSKGNWFINLLNTLFDSQYCIIDTTELPPQEPTNDLITKERLDYLQRIFILGFAVGFRKKILQGYNTAYCNRIFTDMQGNCHFEYNDTTLVTEITDRIPKVFCE